MGGHRLVSQLSICFIFSRGHRSCVLTPHPSHKDMVGRDGGGRKRSAQPTCTFTCQHQMPQRKGKSSECNSATEGTENTRTHHLPSLEPSSAFGQGWDSATHHRAASWDLGSRDTIRSPRQCFPLQRSVVVTVCECMHECVCPVCFRASP